MENLLYLIIVMVLGYLSEALTHKPIQQRNTHIEETVSDILNPTNTEEVIKRKLIKLYNSNAVDKRERIVRLLIQLEKLEDIDSFYSEYDYIRSYIFTTS